MTYRNSILTVLIVLYPMVCRSEETVNSPFLPTVENKTPAPGPAPEGMVWVPGGEFSMGSVDCGTGHCSPETVSDATPVLRVYVDGFWADKTEVTNAQFAKFVEATGYKTIAEIPPTHEDFPTAPLENLVAGSTIFTPTSQPVELNNFLQWWRYEPGADWQHPEGKTSSIATKGDYPVVQVAYADAVAYAKWAHKRLPTEAEWEFAARGGLSGKIYAWGDEFHPEGKTMANTWQGKFPVKDEGADGYAGLAPVAKFPPNGYGLYDVAANAWEWVNDWYRPDTYARMKLLGSVQRNPQGPSASYDPAEPTEKKKVHRGGSYLCTDQYCTRYMVGTRGKGEVSTSSNHVGFRCVKSTE